jgi:hypothetical protein
MENRMNETYRQMKLLGELGLLTATGKDDGGDIYTCTTDEQAMRLVSILRCPESWDESSVLSQCKDALNALREEALKNDAI